MAPTIPSQPTMQARALGLVIALFLVVWFVNLEYRHLVRPDEGRYAEISREMAVSGDWVTPRLNGIKYFEKPPLQYWATASAYLAFGESQWTTRLWTALMGVAGVLATGWFGARLLGRTAGINAAAVLAGSLFYAGLGHIATLDMGLTFWLSVALFAFLVAQGDTRQPQARRWMLLAWAASGAAFLSKGLIALLLPAMAASVYVVVERDRSLLRRLYPGWGLPILLAIALPWVVAVSVADPAFPGFFFLHEHFARFLTEQHHRAGAWWYFIPVLVAGMLPWTTMLAPAAAHAWRVDAMQPAFRPHRFLAVYIGIVFVFFSLSGSKLPSYILPLFPAAALLIGDWLAGIEGARLARHVRFVAALALLGAALSPFASRFGSAKVDPELYRSFSAWLTAGFLMLLAGCACAHALARSGRNGAAVLALGFGGLLLVQAGMTGHEALSPAYSAARIAQTVKPLLSPGMPFYSVRTYEQTLPFYIKRTVTLVDYRDELDFGLQRQPELQIPTVEAFEERWRNDASALAVMGPDLYRELAQRGLPMHKVTEDRRWVVVSRP